MAQRNIKARYHVRALGKQPVTFNKCSVDSDNNVVMQEVTEEQDCYMVLFPQGHSIRVTSFERLKEMGYHLRPRMVDMETGDTVNIGGDPYDFAQQDEGANIVLADDDELNLGGRRKTRTADATA